MKDLILVQDFGLYQHKENGWASSIDIARDFKKQHGHVARDIETLKLGLSKIGETPLPKNEETFDKANPKIVQTTYKDSQGKTQPMYLLNRDAFTLLTVGFTGQKALRFKLAYIGRFNAMETYIKDQSAAKLEYRPMTDAIQAAHDPAKFYHYTTENDMLYRIVLGMSSKQFREQHGLAEGISPKVHMTPAQINLFTRLQRSNTDLIQMGIEYQRRRELLAELAGKIKTPLLKAATG